MVVASEASAAASVREALLRPTSSSFCCWAWLDDGSMAGLPLLRQRLGWARIQAPLVDPMDLSVRAGQGSHRSMHVDLKINGCLLGRVITPSSIHSEGIVRVSMWSARMAGMIVVQVSRVRDTQPILFASGSYLLSPTSGRAYYRLKRAAPIKWTACAI